MPSVLNTSNEFQNSIARAIMREIKEEIEKVREEVVANATAEFEKRVKRIVADVALNVSDYYSLERVGGELLIRVKFERWEK